MSFFEFLKYCHGKVGTIYIARKGSVTVIDFGNETYLVNNTNNGRVIKNPMPEYWSHSIDWSGNFSDYFMFGIFPAETQKYKAEPVLPFTDKHMAKLREQHEFLKATA